MFKNGLVLIFKIICGYKHDTIAYMHHFLYLEVLGFWVCLCKQFSVCRPLWGAFPIPANV